MKALVLFAASFVASTATAAVIGYAQGPAGRLELHDSSEMCTAPALYVEWRPATGEPVRGCWLAAQGQIRAVFLDGDVVTIPAAAIQRPRKT